MDGDNDTLDKTAAQSAPISGSVLGWLSLTDAGIAGRSAMAGYIHTTQYQSYARRRHLSYVGRWLSRDPLEYRDDVNAYGYVHAMPMARVDPQGTECETFENPHYPGSKAYLDCVSACLGRCSPEKFGALWNDVCASSSESHKFFYRPPTPGTACVLLSKFGCTRAAGSFAQTITLIYPPGTNGLGSGARNGLGTMTFAHELKHIKQMGQHHIAGRRRLADNTRQSWENAADVFAEDVRKECSECFSGNEDMNRCDCHPPEMECPFPGHGLTPPRLP
jgi:RHS repeat-associated protein